MARLLVACSRAAFLIAAVLAPVDSQKQPSPIIIFGGAGGSRLEAKLHKEHTVHPTCRKNREWFNLWVNVEEEWPIVNDCWVDNVRLQFSNGTFANNTGVDVRVPGFGNTTSTEYLEPTFKAVKYFHKFVEYFVQLGYVRGKSIRAAPYDWRLSPDLLQLHGSYYTSLIDLVEETYAMNNKTPVTLVTHSYGGPVVLYFLTQMVDQMWKDQFIHAFIPLGGPWKGATTVAHLIVSGDNQGIITVGNINVRPEERTLAASHFLLPTPSPDTWAKDEPLIITPTQNFSAYDYKELYASLNFPTGYEMYQSVSKLLTDLPPPGVPTLCLYGYGVSTPYQFIYTNGYPDFFERVTFSDGDSTVHIKSLRACQKWKSLQKQPLRFKEFDGYIHITFQNNIPVLEEIKSVVFGSV